LNTPTLSGLEKMQFEMNRQHRDSLASFEGATHMAREIAHSLEQTGHLLLLGMGASHYANRMAEPLYRALGLETYALPLSEALYAPLPARARTVLLASQSGESGEVRRYLERTPDLEHHFGLSLDPSSTLACHLPTLLGVGGPEQGFAATRSLMASLALHGAVLEVLGSPQTALRKVLEQPPQISVTAVLEHLMNAPYLIFSGRAELQGLAEVSALHAAELGRIPALALEGGQFRHGPIELLGAELPGAGAGVVLFRAGGPTASLSAALARTCLEAGVTPVVFDASGETPVAGAITLTLPSSGGLSACVAALPPLQHLLLGLAQRRVQHLAEPKYARKITGEV